MVDKDTKTAIILYPDACWLDIAVRAGRVFTAWDDEYVLFAGTYGNYRICGKYPIVPEDDASDCYIQCFNADTELEEAIHAISGFRMCYINKANILSRGLDKVIEMRTRDIYPNL